MRRERFLFRNLKEVGEQQDQELSIAYITLQVGKYFCNIGERFSQGEIVVLDKLTSTNVEQIHILSSPRNDEALNFFTHKISLFSSTKVLFTEVATLQSMRFVRCARILTLSINITFCEVNLKCLIRNATNMTYLNLEFVRLKPMLLLGIKQDDIPRTLNIQLCSHRTFISKSRYLTNDRRSARELM